MENKKTKVHVWMWIQNGKIFKAILSPADGIIKVYDKHDRLLLKRTGLNKIEVKKIERTIIKFNRNKFNKNAEPFRFLNK